MHVITYFGIKIFSAVLSSELYHYIFVCNVELLGCHPPYIVLPLILILCSLGVSLIIHLEACFLALLKIQLAF